MVETVINLKPEAEWRPGVTVDSLMSNAWTTPIKTRIDMLSTGIRTPVGVKIFGKDLADIERSAREVGAVIRKVPGTSSAYAERVNSGTSSTSCR